MLPKGAKIAHYVIEGLIGHGGMGQVYEAVDVRLERRVALKIIRHAPDGDYETFTEFSARLVREAKAAAALSHPNVVAVFDVGETDDGVVYLAMEFVEGTTLRDLVGRGDPPWERRLGWLLDIARALAHAHKAGVVHRDIKPENVIIRGDGVVKVLDFGIARRLPVKVEPGVTTPDRPPKPGIETKDESLVTVKGSVVGTPVYMAPEQIKGADVDARADQFSWGVVAYEVLSGERPWPKSTDLFVILANILTDPPASLRARLPEVPTVVEEALRRTVGKTPDSRFTSMEEVIGALEPYASSSAKVELSTGKGKRTSPEAYAATTRAPIVTSASTAPAPPQPTGTKEATPKVLYALVAVSLVLVIGLYLRQPRAPIATPPPKADAGAAVAPKPVSSIPEAAAAYADGMQLWRDGSTFKAERTLHHAVELDPTLAIGHLELALMTFVRDGTDALDHAQSAYEHRANMSPRDRALLEASEPYLRAVSDPDGWAEKMRELTAQFPRDTEFHFYLGLAREKQFDFEQAKDAFDRALKIDPSFIPALYSKAWVDKQLGNLDAAQSEYEACMRRSYVAAACYQGRFEMMRDEGECKRAEDDARAWAALDQKSLAAHHAIAEALEAQDAPRASVEASLAAAWSLVDEPKARAEAERSDRISLALLGGDFASAERLAMAVERDVPADGDLLERAQAALQIATIEFEMGRVAEAGRVADAFRKKMSGWTPPPLGDNPSIVFVEYVYRAGLIGKPQLAEERAKWLAAEEEREKRGSTKRRWRQAPFRWAVAYAGFAENEEEAKEALDLLPQVLPMPPETRRTARFNFALGKVYVLAGKPAEAEPFLRRATAACVDLTSPQIHTRAHLYLAMALEAKKDWAGARAEYQKVLDRWGKATPRSVTADAARARLAKLPR